MSDQFAKLNPFRGMYPRLTAITPPIRKPHEISHKTKTEYQLNYSTKWLIHVANIEMKNNTQYKLTMFFNIYVKNKCIPRC